MIDNFCEFFKTVVENPKAIVPKHTVGDFLLMRDHLDDCPACDLLVEQTLRNAPPENLTDRMGMN